MRTQRHVAEKVGTSKGGGKQWQTTPKNLPRMQCAKSHIGSLTGLWFLPDWSLGLNMNDEYIYIYIYIYLQRERFEENLQERCTEHSPWIFHRCLDQDTGVSQLSVN